MRLSAASYSAADIGQLLAHFPDAASLQQQHEQLSGAWCALGPPASQRTLPFLAMDVGAAPLLLWGPRGFAERLARLQQVGWAGKGWAPAAELGL